MDVLTFNVISLFSGIEGLGLGIKAAVPRARIVCHVEREAYAQAVLVARMEQAALDQSPVWDDVATFDGSAWRGAVDCVAGGFPCQDISNAGKRAGITGSRSGLWKHFARIIDEARPSTVFVENVSALVNRGLSVVLSDLASLGFDAEWDVFTASEVGAPHRRARFFLLAHSNRTGQPREWLARLLHDNEAQRNNAHRQSGSPVADGVGHSLRHEQGWSGRTSREDTGQLGYDRQEVAYAHGERWQGRIAQGSQARRWPIAWPPGPDDSAAWREWDGPQPAVRRDADGLSNRLDRLRCLGNAVVWQQAALAFATLARRF